MHAIKRHALGLGVVLFLGAAFLTVAPVSASGTSCGSAIWRQQPKVDQVEVATPDGQTVLMPDPEQQDARDDCLRQRQFHTTLAVALGVAGLLGVFWSVVGSPDFGRRRPSQMTV